MMDLIRICASNSTLNNRATGATDEQKSVHSIPKVQQLAWCYLPNNCDFTIALDHSVSVTITSEVTTSMTVFTRALSFISGYEETTSFKDKLKLAHSIAESTKSCPTSSSAECNLSITLVNKSTDIVMDHLASDASTS